MIFLDVCLTQPFPPDPSRMNLSDPPSPTNSHPSALRTSKWTSRDIFFEAQGEAASSAKISAPFLEPKKAMAKDSRMCL